MVDLTTAKTIWSVTPGNYTNFITTALPLGNGRLGGRLLFLIDQLPSRINCFANAHDLHL
jgi:hypothetical protein